MRKQILSITALLAGALSASASVTVQGWWHFGEVADIQVDSSGNGRRFAYAFSTGTGGSSTAGVMPFGIGATVAGFVSTNCLYWTPEHKPAAGMWYPATCSGAECQWNPPATNYVIECWLLPEDTGVRGGSSSWFFGSGSGDFSQPTRDARTGAGGVYLQITNDTSVGYSKIGAFVIANAAQAVPETKQIGDYVTADTNRWMHVAIVNDNGVNTFYVNGVPNGAPQTANTIPNGNIFAGCNPGTTPTFAGYLDEFRISTFAPGQFVVGDLLLRPLGPSIVTQPENAIVWTGGAAPFEIVTAIDAGTTYQWRKGGANIPGATKSIYVFPTAALSDSGSTFDVVSSSGGISVTSSVATLTVADPNPSNVAVYQNAILAEPSLVAYFPVDNDTGTTVTNVKDNTHNGTMEGTAFYDSRTNRAFGSKALGFVNDGAVRVPNNPAFEFNNGFGTIEAILFMSKPTVSDAAVLTEGEGGGMYYLIGVGKDGNSLVYSNDVAGLSWALPQSLIGRRIHLTFVFDNSTNVTPYINGEALATKSQPSFGFAGYAPLLIGGRGQNVPGYGWNGAIDEVALYSAALPISTIQTHYANYFYGTNTAAPSIVSLPQSKTLLAGGAPVLTAVAAGTPPLSYQWTSNNVNIAGATGASLKLQNTTTASTASYAVKVSNAFGSTNSSPVALTFVAAPSGYPASVLKDHPTAYWRQSEASGGAMVDAAGFFDGTYSGAVTLGEPGVFPPDSAVKYTGGKAEVPWSTALNTSGAFSVECWAKSFDNSAIRTMFSSQNRGVGRSGYALYHHANTSPSGISGAFEVHMGDASGVTMQLFGPAPVATGIWYHVVLTYDGSTSKLYVGGTLGPDGTGSGTYNPNSNKPLTFGQRTDGQWQNDGALDEVAFYDYALSEQQIIDHWKNVWSPAAITQQPAGATVNEWGTATLTGAASGIPNTYQWTKNGAALAEVSNSDGARHYPNGVTNATLTIAEVHPADAGQYRLLASNPLGNATSDPATLVVTADTQAPIVISVDGLGTVDPSGVITTPLLVRAAFDERVDVATAGDKAKYTIDGGVTVGDATVSSDWRSVILKTSGLTPGQKYALTVTGVKDQASTPNTSTAKTVAFFAPVMTTGVVLWDYYFPVTPQGVDNLLALPTYPLAPNTNVNLTTFDSTEFTGGDLNGKFGAGGDNYGASISGWITPAVTTNYLFFLASDDASRLYLSPDANPATAVQIAEETGCCHGFQDPGNPTTSLPQPLTAGQRYFIRAVMTEGTGGDYVKVAWKTEGDTNAAPGLQPISGSMLSAFAPVPRPKFTSVTYKASSGELKITWVGAGTLEQSPDMSAWTAVAGNPPSPYTVSVSGANRLFYRVKQ